jgi:hypothetical protein
MNELTLNENDRKAFFINLYNCLVIDATIQGMITPTSSFIERLTMYATASYNVGGRIYSLNDIENGILRSNKSSPTPCSVSPFASDDPRIHAVLPLDPRIHFALNCGAKSCPPILVYNGDNIDKDLSRATLGFLKNNISVNVDLNEITLSSLFQWYEDDFGDSNINILKWILLQIPNTTTSSQLYEDINRLVNSSSCNDIRFRYSEYNWSMNVMHV